MTHGSDGHSLALKKRAGIFNCLGLHDYYTLTFPISVLHYPIHLFKEILSNNSQSKFKFKSNCVTTKASNRDGK